MVIWVFHKVANLQLRTTILSIHSTKNFYQAQLQICVTPTCIEVKKLNQSNIAAEMYISVNLLLTIADNLGLDTNANAKFVPNKNPGDAYRSEVLELLKKQGEISSNDVKKMNSRAYSWLITFEPDWLRGLLTPEKEKIYWKEKDEERLSLFQSIYDELQKNGNRRRRVTLGYLCSLAGITGSKESQQVKNQLRLTPKLKNFMSEVLETEPAWIERRVSEIIAHLNENGHRLTVNKVRNHLTLRQCKFQKYRGYIEKMVEKHKIVLIRCPHCGTDKVWKDQRYKQIQNYICKNPDCSHKRFKVQI